MKQVSIHNPYETRQADIHMEADHYVQSAAVYDILSGPHWSARQASVRSAFQPVGDLAGVVLDVGAGSGTALRLIADTIPNCSILALEPSASMRIGLMTKVLLDDELRRRVTIEEQSIQNASLPDRLSAVLICGCIGYLDGNERGAMWKSLASRLDSRGLILADVMMLDRPHAVPETKVASVEVGRRTYEMWVSGEPGGSDLMLWNMGCRILEGDEVIRSFNVVREWHTFGIRELLEEASAAGLMGEVLKDSPVPAAVLGHSRT